jgi:hypothetical protein
MRKNGRINKHERTSDKERNKDEKGGKKENAEKINPVTSKKENDMFPRSGIRKMIEMHHSPKEEIPGERGKKSAKENVPVHAKPLSETQVPPTMTMKSPIYTAMRREVPGPSTPYRQRWNTLKNKKIAATARTRR